MDCPKCGAFNSMTAEECDSCGYDFPKASSAASRRLKTRAEAESHHGAENEDDSDTDQDEDDSMRDSVIVSRKSFKSADSHAIIQSNVSFVNALLAEHIALDEISHQAVVSYYVDYYVAEMNNGGFSQFVFNSQWAEPLVELLREGLELLGARRHVALFEKNVDLVAKLGRKKLRRFLESEYFGTNPDRDVLSGNDERFFRLSEKEDLSDLNAKWLRSLPNLVVLPITGMKAEIARRAAAVPDREERIAAAREAEPDYFKLIRALCRKADHELEDVTAGDPSHVHEGQSVLAWHFITDRGHFYMVEVDGEAIMFDADSHERVTAIDA